MNTYARALTIAGSDSGGGAGIQADLKTFSALGCYGMSVLTALTAQNTVAVTAIHPVPPDFIDAQLAAVLSDIGTDSIKVGMLHSPEVIGVVAGRLAGLVGVPLVIDPVMVAKSGDKLLQDDAINALREELIPLATVITPNIPEAEVLLGRRIAGEDRMADTCRELAGLGCRAVLLKGGHLSGDASTDWLYLPSEDRLHPLTAPRIDTPNSHGTGCTLSSAVAAYLARGHDLVEAVKRSKTYISEALAAGARYTLGKGHGPVHHFYARWP